MKALIAYLALQVVIVGALAVTMPAALAAGAGLLALLFAGFYLLARALGYGKPARKAPPRRRPS